MLCILCACVCPCHLHLHLCASVTVLKFHLQNCFLLFAPRGHPPHTSWNLLRRRKRDTIFLFVLCFLFVFSFFFPEVCPVSHILLLSSLLIQHQSTALCFSSQTKIQSTQSDSGQIQADPVNQTLSLACIKILCESLELIYLYFVRKIGKSCRDLFNVHTDVCRRSLLYLTPDFFHKYRG